MSTETAAVTGVERVERHLPAPRSSRQGIGLCFSGGGFRATLFHLGSLRRLNELGVLANPDLRTVSSVSGGSISSAFLALAFGWPLDRIVPTEEWNARLAGPVREFTRHDIRTGAFFRSFLPWRTGVGELARAYDEALRRVAGASAPVALARAPSRPEFVFCATDLKFGANWVSTARCVGDYQAGYVPTPEGWTVGLAVAASSCLPPMFQAFHVPFTLGRWAGGLAHREEPARWEAAMQKLRLVDGGYYDNMGLEPVWKSHAVVLASDAGGLHGFKVDDGLLWRFERHHTIAELQSRALRKRWLIASFQQGVMEGAYWTVSGARNRYDRSDSTGYSKALAREAIAQIRTDLDAFSDAEAAVLENHGYLLADKAVLAHCPQAALRPEAPLVPPHPEWLPPTVSEARIRQALAGSEKRKVPFGRKERRVRRPL